MQPATTLPGTTTARATTARHTAAGQRRAAALGLLLCMALAGTDPVLAQAESDDGSAVDWYGRPTVRLQQDLLPADGRPVQAGDGNPQPARRTMLWTQRAGVEVGLGLVQPQSAPRGAAPTLVRGVSAAPTAADAAVPTQAVLALGRQVATGVDMRVGLGVPLGHGAARAAAGGGPLTLAGQAGADSLFDSTRRAELRVGMALVPTRAYDGLRRGLAMRMELSGSTTLTMKPRGRRVTVQLNSQW